MKKFSISYTLLLFIIWTMFSLWILLVSDLKGAYIFMGIGSLPTSLITDGNLYSLYIGGVLQWVFVGWVMDKLIPKISFSVEDKTLVYFVKILFILGVLGLLLSAMVIPNGFASAIIYNISAGVIMVSIGFKIIFLDR